jgi:Holliday junction DNA helicase RuvA
MIARLAGRLVRKAPDFLIVDVNGVGYRVMVSLQTFCALPAEGAEVVLEISTQVRENALDLFGFGDAAEQALFALLLTVSGVGPRVALNVLSGIPAAELLGALRSRDVARLVAIPGVGKKTAERLVVELQDRVASLAQPAADSGLSGDGVEREAVSALVNLGYREGHAEQAVREVLRRGTADLVGVIREALRRLSA